MFGLEVFSANGETVFEAGKSYVKIVGQGRTVVDNSGVRVYDNKKNLRIKLGDLR